MKALEHCFRNIHTGTQHAFVGEKVYTDSPDVLLGNVEDAIAL